MTKGVLRLGMAVALLIFVWNIADGPAAVARLQDADWRWLLAAAIAVNMQTVLSAWRWCVTAGALGQRIGMAQAVGEYYLSQLINQTVPGGVLGDAARAVRARHSADMLRSGQAVVIERFAGQLAMAAVLLPALVWAGRGLWALGLVAVGAALLIALKGVPRLRAIQKPLWQALFGPHVRGAQTALGLAIVACNLAGFAFCAHAIGVSLPLTAVLTLIPLILTAMLVPFSIAGWGWREGAAAALFPLAGAAPEAGVAASAAFGAVLLASALPGLAWIAGRTAANAPSTSVASPENRHISDVNSGDIK
ncbi:YbhN family protein [Pseudorhodobacter sp. W20_MBD10_FR17]|uniref:lysylphosphatidylglycerol synthase transmembrane domain-containing protein n=1 Tax=Pseudorhodobacter sp. W20_MBD10_FR17 TaxID=3240266 RepID=UPI003F9789AA